MYRIPAFGASAVALVAQLLPLPLHGADDGASPAELDEIVVTASPFRHSAEELVQPVDLLAGDALDRRRRGTIGDVLADRPGIANASFGPGVGRPVIRGQSGARVQVLSNGISTMDASAISADHAVAVDPLTADQIEVIKGPATLIYGGSASAGIVNVVDDRLPDAVTPGLSLRGDLSYGDNADESNSALRARYGVGNWQFGASYSRRDADDFEIPGFAERAGADHDAHDHDDHDEHAEDDHDEHAGHDTEHEHADEATESGARGVLDNSSLTSERVAVSAAWAAERGMIGAAVSRFTTDYGVPGHGHGHGDEEAHEDEAAHAEDTHDEAHGEHEAHDHDGVRIDLEQTRVDLRGLLRAPLPGVARAETRIGVNDYEHREIEPGGAVGTTFDVSETEARFEFEHVAIGDWVGVAGLQLRQRDFDAIGEEAFVAPTETDTAGLFLVEGYRFGAHRLELGARVDRTRHDPEGPQFRTRFTTMSLSAGASFLVSEHLHLRVNAQSAERAPAIEEVYAFGPHIATSAFERGDEDIDPETANNIDVSLGRDDGRWTWELTAFYNRIDDYIYAHEVDDGLNADGSGSPSSDGEADRVNAEGIFDPEAELLLLDYAQSDAELYGAEAETRFVLIDDAGRGLGIRAFGDLVRGRLRDGGENLPRITPARFGIGADARVGAVSLDVALTRVTEQDRTAPLETATPAYSELSADIGYAVPTAAGTMTVYARGRNLLDETQRDATSFLKDVAPRPGRSLFVGLRFDFATGN